MTNKYYCMLGRDSHDCERREISRDTDRLMSALRLANANELVSKVRDNFLSIERGEGYYSHRIPPVSFFYCPLTVSGGEAVSVWGECGFYDGGREFRYSHFYIEDYKSLGEDCFGRIFTSKFCKAEQMTAVFDKSEPTEEFYKIFEYDESFVPKSNARSSAVYAVEQICEGKTVVVKLGRSADFNSAAREMLIDIVSLLPCGIRKQIGFATYLRPDRIKELAAQSNNIRLIIADSDLELDISAFKTLCLVDGGKEYSVSKEYVDWAEKDFAEREERAKRFIVSKRRVPMARLVAVLNETENDDTANIESRVNSQDKAVKDTQDSEALKTQAESAKSEVQPKDENSKKLLIAVGVIAFAVGLVVGLLI